MTTKVEHINSAYSKIRISGITINPTPEDTETALWRLEDLMWELYGRTLDFNYNFEDVPLSTSESGVDRIHHNMIASNLAMLLLPDFGKDATPELAGQARASFSASSAVIARKRLQGVNYPNRMPIGTGNRNFGFRSRKYFPAAHPAVTDASNYVLKCGEIEDFEESFFDWLGDETIASYTISVEAGVTLVDGIIDPSDNPADYPTSGVTSDDPNFATDCGAGTWVCNLGAFPVTIDTVAGTASQSSTVSSQLDQSGFVWDPTKTYLLTIQYGSTKGYSYGTVLMGNETAFGEAGHIIVDDPDPFTPEYGGTIDRVTGIQTTEVTGISGTGFTYVNNTELNDSISFEIVDLRIEEVMPVYVPIDSYFSDGTVHYRLEADACPYAGTACVQIEVTTDSGRVEKRQRLIEIARTC